MGIAQPIRWVYGNISYGKDLCDAWAIFEVDTSSYDCLSAERKAGLFSDVRRFVSAIEADFQLMRVASVWDHDRFAEELAGSQRGPRADVHARYVDAHRRHLSGIGSAQPSVWVAVRLKEPDQDLATYVSRVFSRPPRRMLGELAGMVNLHPARELVVEELERHRVQADQAHARIEDTLSCRAATAQELQWLIRRGFCRSLGEPTIDALDEPAALVFERNGKAVLRPIDADVLRWADGHIERRHGRLDITSELGTSHQTGLVCGALPELSYAPSRRLELLFAPPESLDFGIDMTLNARYLPNGLATSMVRRRIQDADQVASAEAEGDQGVSDIGAERMGLARDLLRMLQGSGTPPLLQATLAVQVSARDPEELERRVETTRRVFGDTRLHRPVGYDQLELFCQHMPGQPSRVSGYEAPMTPLQLAAMAPTAAHKVGSAHGFYLGHTANLARQPVVFNLREGSDIDRATGILKLGSLGRGKTIGTQKLYHEAFAQNARIIDVDPKGDHTFHLLDEVAPFAEVIDLKQAKRYRGILDPLRIGVADVHQTAAVTFLRELLPIRSSAEWETSILQAVNAVCSRAAEASLWEVISALGEGDEVDRQVAKTLTVHATSSFAQLGFHDRNRPLPAVGEAQVTYIPIRGLPRPAPGVARGEMDHGERIGQQVLRLINLFAGHLMSADRDRLKIYGFDEGWRLLKDEEGRRMLEEAMRMGRSELTVPIIGTQLVTDAMTDTESLENLIGATFVYGMNSEAEARLALELLDLDPSDERLTRRLMDFEHGRCLFRDHRGRVEAVQVEVLYPGLLNSLSTTPSQANREDTGDVVAA